MRVPRRTRLVRRATFVSAEAAAFIPSDDQYQSQAARGVGAATARRSHFWKAVRAFRFGTIVGVASSLQACEANAPRIGARQAVPVERAMEAVSLDSLAEISLTVEASITAIQPTEAPYITTTTRVTYRRQSDGSWSKESALMTTGPNGPVEASRVIEQNDSTFVVMQDGSRRHIGEAAQLRSGNAMVDSARAAWVGRFRDSLRVARRPPASRTRLGRDPRTLLFASKRAAEQVHAAFRAASGSSRMIGARTTRYSGTTAAGAFEIDADSATGAISRQFTVAPDGNSVTVLHSYAPLPGGDLVRTASHYAFSGRPGTPTGRTLNITYTNVLAR